MKPLLFKLLACLLLTTLIFGCATTAKINMITGQELKGNIVGSDDANVYVGNGFTVVPLKKAEIVKITHPGKGGRIVWSIVAGYGAVNMIYVLSNFWEVFDEIVGEDPSPESLATATAGLLLLPALGFPLAYRSFKLYSESKNALNRPYTPPEE